MQQGIVGPDDRCESEEECAVRDSRLKRQKMKIDRDVNKTILYMVNKIIHQIVIGSIPNQLIKRCLRSWMAMTEVGYEIRIWDEAAMHTFVQERYPFAWETLSAARNLGEATDIGRYLIVYHYCGYYVDWDIELLDKTIFLEIADQFDNGLLILDPANGTLECECFSALKGETFLKRVVEDIVEIYNAGDRDTLSTTQYTGPFRMRDTLLKYKETKQDFVDVNDIFLYSYREIWTKPERLAEHAMIHYWTNTWFGK